MVGESGCGKSTFGRTILHLPESTSGKILFHGEDVTHVNAQKLRQLRESMQIIFQDPFSSLNPRMIASQTISEPLLPTGRYSRAKIEMMTDGLMQTVGLAARLRHSYPHELDGGRRQRIGIARVGAQTLIHRVRRAGFRAGRIHSGADIKSDAGPAARQETYIRIYHARSVGGEAHIRRNMRYIPGPAGRKAPFQAIVSPIVAPLYKGAAFRHTHSRYSRAP